MIIVFAFALGVTAYSYENKIEIGLGLFIPSGEYSEPGIPTIDYTSGVNFGAVYLRNLDSGSSMVNFSLGGFLDIYSFGSETVTFDYSGVDINIDFDVFTVAFGFAAEAALSLDNLEPYVRLLLGLALNDATANASSSGVSFSVKDDGRAWCAAIEGGARYRVTETIDLGLAIKYHRNAQDIVGGIVSQLGGLTIKASVGFNF